MSSSPRQWQDPERLREVVETPAGTIALLPLRYNAIRFETRGEIDIGRNVTDIRASGCVDRSGGLGWIVTELDAERTDLRNEHARRQLSEAQTERTRDVILAIVADWAEANAEKMAQANAIDRNNDALRLEEQIAKHVEALHVLRRELKRCEQGLPFDRHPEEAATDRRR